MPDFTIFSPKMRARTAKLVLAAVMVAFVVAMVARVEAQQKVLLKDVQVVSAVPGQLTTARRSRPVPQLQCQGRVCEVTPQSIQCTNVGWDGIDAQWNCKARGLKKGYQLASATVNCEGFDFPNDPYILAGSCFVEYTLKRKAGASYPPPHQQQQQYPDARRVAEGWNEHASAHQQQHHQHADYDKDSMRAAYTQNNSTVASAFGEAFVKIVSIVAFILLCYCCCTRDSSGDDRNAQSPPPYPGPSFNLGGRAAGGAGSSEMEDRVPHSASQSSFYSSSTPATASAAAASGPGSGAGHGSGSGSGSGAGKSHAAPPSYSSATSSNTTTSVDNASSGTWRGALAGAAAGYVLARVVDSISQPSVSSTTTTTTPTSAPFGYPGTYPTYAQPPTSSYTAMPSASNYSSVDDDSNDDDDGVVVAGHARRR